MKIFFARTFAVALVLILSATGLWAAGAEEEEPAGAADKKYVTDPTTGKVVTAPEYGGTLTAAVPHPITSNTDPYFGWTSVQIQGVVEKLGMGNWGIDRDVWDFKSGPLSESVMTGTLAESWETPDPLTYIFHIRKGVQWHDKAPMNGRELTADDVVYTFQRMLGRGDFTEPSPFGGASPLTSIPFESITATDKWMVVMKLKEIYLPALVVILSERFGYIMPPEVIEQHGDITDWRNLVGTGPFELNDHDEGSSLTFTKNPDYWGYDEKYPENRLPYVDEFRFPIILERATRLAALRSGKLDFLGPSGGVIRSVDQADSLRRTNPEIVLHKQWFRSNGVSYGADLRKPPWNDIRVRKAMQMALDLETITTTLFKGQANATPMGLIAVKGYHIPFEEWPEEVKKTYRYDPEGAEALLDEAGYTRGPDGIRFKTVLALRRATTLRYAEVAASYWSEIGVDVEVEVLQDPAFFERRSSGTWEGLWWSTAGMIYDPATMVAWYRSTGGNQVDADWPELDAMVDAALAATTVEEQQRLIRETDMYAIEKHWMTWGPKSPQWWALQPWVKGYNGEMELAPNEWGLVNARLWIDSELKEAMGY